MNASASVRIWDRVRSSVRSTRNISAQAAQGWRAVNEAAGSSAQIIDMANHTTRSTTSSSSLTGIAVWDSRARLRSVPNQANAISSPAACEAESTPGMPVRKVVGIQSAMPSGRFRRTSGR